MIAITADAQHEIDAYLSKLRRRLRGIDEENIREILDELRSHILDKSGSADGQGAGNNVAETLRALGNPEQLAAEYLTDNLFARAEVSRSPARIVGVLFRWASLSMAGFLVLLSSILGYLIGVAFLLCALLKPIHPQTAGLWIYPSGTGTPRFLCDSDSAVHRLMLGTYLDGGSYQSGSWWAAGW